MAMVSRGEHEGETTEGPTSLMPALSRCTHARREASRSVFVAFQSLRSGSFPPLPGVLDRNQTPSVRGRRQICFRVGHIRIDDESVRIQKPSDKLEHFH